MKRLTTTSHAVLSLLAMRSWTAYELTQQMHRNVGLFWPRAERGIYDEVKNLVAHGLAHVDETPQGRRHRSVYTITDEGRTRLGEWLSTPVALPLQVQSESVLRVAFAENGSLADLTAAVGALRAHVAEQAGLAASVAEQYLAGTGPYPERIHLIGLVMRYLVDHLETFDAWAQWVAAETGGWAGVTSPEDVTHALEIVREVAERAHRVTNLRIPR